MPIRFRCKYCEQLLGIAHRKIGQEVRCPECHKMVLVPAEDALEGDEPTQKKGSLLAGGAAGLPHQPSLAEPGVDPRKEAGAPKISPAAPETFDAELYQPPDITRSGGIILSPLHTVLLTIGAVIILTLAFAVGLLVGRYVL